MRQPEEISRVWWQISHPQLAQVQSILSCVVFSLQLTHRSASLWAKHLIMSTGRIFRIKFFSRWSSDTRGSQSSSMICVNITGNSCESWWSRQLEYDDISRLKFVKHFNSAEASTCLNVMSFLFHLIAMSDVTHRFDNGIRYRLKFTFFFYPPPSSRSWQQKPPSQWDL